MHLLRKGWKFVFSSSSGGASIAVLADYVVTSYGSGLLTYSRSLAESYGFKIQLTNLRSILNQS